MTKAQRANRQLRTRFPHHLADKAALADQLAEAVLAARRSPWGEGYDGKEPLPTVTNWRSIYALARKVKGATDG